MPILGPHPAVEAGYPSPGTVAALPIMNTLRRQDLAIGADHVARSRRGSDPGDTRRSSGCCCTSLPAHASIPTSRGRRPLALPPITYPELSAQLRALRRPYRDRLSAGSRGESEARPATGPGPAADCSAERVSSSGPCPTGDGGPSLQVSRPRSPRRLCCRLPGTGR